MSDAFPPASMALLVPNMEARVELQRETASTEIVVRTTSPNLSGTCIIKGASQNQPRSMTSVLMLYALLTFHLA